MKMRKILIVLAIALFPSCIFAQGITPNNAISIVGTNGTTLADVTAGHAIKTDVTSVAGAAVSGQVAGSVPVTIVSGAGSGGTAAADEAAFTEGTTNFTPGGCYYKSSPTSLTTGQMGAFGCMPDRSLFVDLKNYAGTALGSPSNYGTSPGAVEVAGVNAFVTNTVPVTLTSTTITGSVAVTGTFWQATQPVSIATAPALVASSAVIGEVNQNDGCGTTVASAALQALPTSATAIFSSTTCVNVMSFTNTSSTTQYTLTVTDNQGSPVTYLSALTLNPLETVTFPLYGAKFTTGIKWSASNAAVTGLITGHQ